MLQELRRLHPRNRLVVLEAGSTALRGGNAVRAEGLLTEGLAMLAADKRQRIPGEEGLWRYKRGAARVALGRLEEATQDLQAAVSPDTAGWVQGRARVELAKIALRAERRRDGSDPGASGGGALRAGSGPSLRGRCTENAEERSWPVR